MSDPAGLAREAQLRGHVARLEAELTQVVGMLGEAQASYDRLQEAAENISRHLIRVLVAAGVVAEGVEFDVLAVAEAYCVAKRAAAIGEVDAKPGLVRLPEEAT
jgi:hypothetical protein